MRYSRSLLDCLADFANTRPESPALIMGAEQVTYAELCSMAVSAYRGIEALHLPEQGRIALHATKSPRTVALIVACLLSRRPFLLPSTELGASALDTLLRRAGATHLLAADAVDGVGDREVYKIDVATEPYGTHDLTDHPLDPDAISFIFTTSGSTGLPKVVPLTFGAVERFADWAIARFDIRPGTIVLNYAPFNFDLCLLDVRATLKAGGTTVLVEPDRGTNGRHLAGLLHTHSVQVVQAVPMLFRLLSDAHDGSGFPSVRHVITTGDKVPVSLLAELPRLFPMARFYNVYGSTETNDSFLHEFTDLVYGGGGDLPIGRPLPGVDALVLGKGGTVLHGDATGELLVSTPFQTPGYLAVDGAGADKFVPMGPDGRPYFRSGDLVRRTDGVFTLVGRNDSQVKVRGTRVNLEEIEQVLLRHDRIVGAAVVAVPDDVAGVVIHAVVRRDTEEPLGVLVLREYCRRHLPRAALPTTIRVVDGPLPTTSTGKTDRRAVITELLKGN